MNGKPVSQSFSMRLFGYKT